MCSRHRVSECHCPPAAGERRGRRGDRPTQRRHGDGPDQNSAGQPVQGRLRGDPGPCATSSRRRAPFGWRRCREESRGQSRSGSRRGLRRSSRATLTGWVRAGVDRCRPRPCRRRPPPHPQAIFASAWLTGGGATASRRLGGRPAPLGTESGPLAAPSGLQEFSPVLGRQRRGLLAEGLHLRLVESGRGRGAARDGLTYGCKELLLAGRRAEAQEADRPT